MATIYDQVPGLQACLALKAAGHPQETLHVWAQVDGITRVVSWAWLERNYISGLRVLCAAPLYTEYEPGA